ncbi:MAG: hypothetical protein JWP74_1068 [Marmoricola sp.]|nr:hypothetical protein [Marmoricola sp.]
MLAIRGVLIAAGVAIGGYGAYMLLGLGTDNLVATVKWLVGGVVLHDGVLGPVVIALAFVVTRIARIKVPAPVVVGGIVLGSVTLLAIPVLGRFGAAADRPTLLDRNYVAGWFAFAGLTLLVVAGAVLRGRFGRGGGDGPGTGGR